MNLNVVNNLKICVGPTLSTFTEKQLQITCDETKLQNTIRRVVDQYEIFDHLTPSRFVEKNKLATQESKSNIFDKISNINIAKSSNFNMSALSTVSNLHNQIQIPFSEIKNNNELNLIQNSCLTSIAPIESITDKKAEAKSSENLYATQTLLVDVPHKIDSFQGLNTETSCSGLVIDEDQQLHSEMVNHIEEHAEVGLSLDSKLHFSYVDTALGLHHEEDAKKQNNYSHTDSLAHLVASDFKNMTKDDNPLRDSSFDIEINKGRDQHQNENQLLGTQTMHSNKECEDVPEFQISRALHIPLDTRELKGTESVDKVKEEPKSCQLIIEPVVEDIFDNGCLLKTVQVKGDTTLLRPKIGDIAYVFMKTVNRENKVVLQSDMKWVVVGEGDTIIGVDVCLQTMYPGEQIVLNIDSCYGKFENGVILKPGTNLNVELTLMYVKKFPTTLFENYDEIYEICSKRKNIGNLHMDRGDYKSAIDCYTTSLKHINYIKAPKLVTLKHIICNNMAFTRIKLKEYAKAIDLLEIVLSCDPNNWKALMRLWFCYEESSDLNKALSCAKKACSIRADPDALVGLEKLKKRIIEQNNCLNQFYRKMVEPIRTNVQAEIVEPHPFWTWKKIALASACILGIGVTVGILLKKKN
ncbi:hypothetical protein MXB_5093 [Myxobolus squamalis]|nr:hypothetical protein MXB_5093 [Myxobolus squamalis]